MMKQLTKQLMLACFVGLFSFGFSPVEMMGQKALLKGVIKDAQTKEPLIGATVKSEEEFTITEVDGTFALTLDKGTHTIVINYLNTLLNKKITMAGEEQSLEILMDVSFEIDEIIVTTGRFEKNQLETDFSVETLNPQFLERNSTATVSEVLDKVPGLTMIERQADIRGGSGFAFGTGSRVLLLQNDIPALSFDAAFPNWDDVPLENVAQIEVIKGAASALYGSSALNGVINVRTAYAKDKPETEFASFLGYYMMPKTDSIAWWSKQEQPHQFGTSLAHRQKFGKLDVVLGGYFYQLNSFRKDTYNKFGRANFSLRYNLNPKLTIGLNGNGTKGSNAFYFLWANAEEGLLTPTAFSGASESTTFRYTLDPFLNYLDSYGNQHRFQARYSDFTNNANEGRAIFSKTWYTEYQFKKTIEKLGLGVAAGTAFTTSGVEAELYSNAAFTGQNYAIYGQLEKKFFDTTEHPLTITLGSRYEINVINAPEIVSSNDTIPDAKVQEGKPVIRLGLNYRLFKYSSLRASFGQGYRFPAIGEKYVNTTFGPIPVISNLELESETGWNAELGLKQAWAMGDQRIKGFVDLALFWTEYANMMEFVLTGDGFQGQNVGDTQIKGLEFSIAGEGDITEHVSASFLMGYTYIDPIYKMHAEIDSLAQTTLKYRVRHSFKTDVETQIFNVIFGINATYFSFMEKIDPIFEVLNGIGDFRKAHNSGTKVIDLRLGYQINENIKVNLLLKNAFNEEYAVRPGILDAPRNLVFRLDGKF